MDANELRTAPAGGGVPDADTPVEPDAAALAAAPAPDADTPVEPDAAALTAFPVPDTDTPVEPDAAALAAAPVPDADAPVEPDAAALAALPAPDTDAPVEPDAAALAAAPVPDADTPVEPDAAALAAFPAPDTDAPVELDAAALAAFPAPDTDAPVEPDATALAAFPAPDTDAPVEPDAAEPSVMTAPPEAVYAAPVPDSDIPASPAADDGQDARRAARACDPWETPRPGRRYPARGKRQKRRRRRRSHSGLWGFLAGLVAAGLLALGARLWERNLFTRPADRFIWDYRDGYEEEREEAAGIAIPTWPIGGDASFQVLREHGDTLSAQEVYRLVNPSVVTVVVSLHDDAAAVGTGVIFSRDGYFVTNYHVVEGGTECLAFLDNGTPYKALYVAGDEESDLAVLKMDCEGEVSAAEFGDSDLLTVGDDVYAIGNPLGIEFRGTLTNGIVSAINRDVQVEGRNMTLIQTNAALNSGNSGGPLINAYGQVVGINVVKMSSSRSTVEGLGFAIPSASMDRLVNDLLTFGVATPEPVLGVSVSRTGAEVTEGVWGIEVQVVNAGSAAEAAGILVGDYIVSAGGDEIHTSQDLLRARRRFHIGDEMPVTVWREGEWIDVTLVLLAAS